MPTHCILICHLLILLLAGHILTLSYQSSLGSPQVSDKFISLPIRRRLLATKSNSSGADAIGLFKRESLSYLTEISIGSSEPSQKFSLILDTGSSVLWVPSTKCSDAFCKHRRLFDGSKSSSYVCSETAAFYKYGDGLTIRGVQARDEVHLSDSLIVKNQTFLEVCQSGGSEVHSWSVYDGLLGLGFRRLTGSSSYPILVESMKQQGLIDRLMFSMHLHHQEELDKLERQTSGELVFGSRIDSSKFRGQLEYFPLTRASFWEFRLDNIRLVGGSKDNIVHNYHNLERDGVCTNGCRAIVDTGTYLIVGLRDQVERLNRALGGVPTTNGLYMIRDCRDISRRKPRLVFTINGRELSLEPHQYLIPVERAGCLSGIRAQDSALPFWILGDLFIGNYYAVFDMEEKRIGLAELRRQRQGLDQLLRP